MAHQNQNKPFNDVIDHMEKHTGGTFKTGGRLPRPIKIIGYILFGSLLVMFIIGVSLSMFL
ncbi:hypothetical protein [Gracilibacillus massiliensis]|uniref:hypothetical protein n=1 Tax=Gracilibacillus massiliensis TaxID=1564956 RepID=UPI00071E1706|nr:hypothetical protein [Gracilibacillus massiliensis]